MSRIALFFDLDDTLIDHRGAEEDALRDLHARLPGGLSWEEFTGAYRPVNLGLWDGYARGEVTPCQVRRTRFGAALAAAGHPVDAAVSVRLGEEYLVLYGSRWRLLAGATDVLAWAARFATVGVISNGFADVQHSKIERLGLGRWVSHVILAEEAGALKPARAIFEAAQKAAGPHDRWVYVGDSWATDIEGALAAGWEAVHFDPSGCPIDGVPVVRALADLPAALARLSITSP